MVMGYCSVAVLFWQLSIDLIVIVQCKRCGLDRRAWDTPPFLLIVSPTPPVQSVDAYVRSVSHVTTKRKEVDQNLWVWGLFHARFAHVGAPLKTELLVRYQLEGNNIDIRHWKTWNYLGGGVIVNFIHLLEWINLHVHGKSRTVFGDRVLLCEQ